MVYQFFPELLTFPQSYFLVFSNSFLVCLTIFFGTHEGFVGMRTGLQWLKKAPRKYK
jgi:hypothetical protein